MHHWLPPKCSGNAALETVLFAPLALFLILGAAEAGSVLSDKAAISEALRAGLNTAVHYDSEAPIAAWDDGIQSLLSSAPLRALVENVAKEITAGVTKARGNQSGGFSVIVQAVVLPIDQSTGARLPALHIAHKTGPSNPDFDIRQASPAFSYRSAETFLNQRLAADSSAPSVFATALPGFQSRNETGGSKVNFLPYSILLYAEVDAVARTIGGGIARNLLGSPYGIEEQELIQLRTQLD